jgi:hypothetical protein
MNKHRNKNVAEESAMDPTKILNAMNEQELFQYIIRRFVTHQFKPEFLANKVSRGELFALLQSMAPAVGCVGFHAIVIHLLLEKLGVTDAEIEAHKTKLAELKVSEIEAEQLKAEAALATVAEIPPTIQ